MDLPSFAAHEPCLFFLRYKPGLGGSPGGVSISLHASEFDAKWRDTREKQEAIEAEEEADAHEAASGGEGAVDEEPVAIATATVGEAVTLRGAMPEIQVSVLYVQDPASLQDEEVEADEGMRYVGVFLQIRNTGTETYDGRPSMEARLFLRGGAAYEAEIGWLKPDLDELMPVDPGESAAGFLTFEIPENTEVDAFRFVFEAFPARDQPEAAVWRLR